MVEAEEEEEEEEEARADMTERWGLGGGG